MFLSCPTKDMCMLQDLHPGLFAMSLCSFIYKDHMLFQQECVMISPRKQGKENYLNGNNESNLNLQNQTPKSDQKKLKEMKHEELREICNGNKVDVKCSTKSSPTKSSLEESSKEQTEANGRNGSLPSKKKGSKKKTSKDAASDVSRPKDAREKNSPCHEDAKAPDAMKEEDRRYSKDVSNHLITAEGTKEETTLDIHKDANNNKTRVKDKPLTMSQENMKCTVNGNKEFVACVSLPLGSRLTTVAELELTTEDVGHALQFLEFCAAFGKVCVCHFGFN